MMTIGDRPPPDRESGDPVVVRSEERLTVGLPIRVSGGVLLRKKVVTETVTYTVEVRREELEVLELPVEELTMPNTSLEQAATYQLCDREFELVLHEERVVVSTQVVPVERVTLRTRVVTSDVPVTAEVRAEQVELLKATATEDPTVG